MSRGVSHDYYGANNQNCYIFTLRDFARQDGGRQRGPVVRETDIHLEAIVRPCGGEVVHEDADDFGGCGPDGGGSLQPECLQELEGPTPREETSLAERQHVAEDLGASGVGHGGGRVRRDHRHQ